MSPSNFSNGGHLSGSLALWVAVSLVGLWLGAVRSSAGDKFSFPMHHRFSDPVKRMLPASLDMPKKGTVDYYRAMVHRDRAIHPGRRLSSEGGDRSHLTFASGNDTLRIASLGYLLYANIMVGTPSLSFLVALDTGSDLFWLPCDCLSCVRSLKTPDGEEILFNIYSPNVSSTASVIPCNSTSCSNKPRCLDARGHCHYQVFYGSNSTSSTGVLVKDVLRLITDDDQGKAVDAEITFGCGRTQTGFLLGGAAPNGLFSLGMTNISVPSILAGEGLISNSFSMCFSPDSVGRISFGDKGSPDQGETPFNLGHSDPFYNISITGANVGGTTHDLQFTAIFDSGTSITQLSDPAYTLISDSFNSHAKDKRTSDPSMPFEYCYEPSPNRSSLEIPALNLMMKGGDVFSINKPVAYISIDEFTLIYCLAMVRDSGMNIIGQNFMTGYRVVFDRERMVLGWKESDCYSADNTSLPGPAPAPAPNAGAASGPTGTSLKDSSSPAPSSGSWDPSPSIYVLAIVLCPILAVF